VTLPDEALRWTAAERELAAQLLEGRTVAVNVRRGGPHRRLIPWLVEQGLITYVGHAGRRHGWPESDFANPFLSERGMARPEMLRRYRGWLVDQPDLLARIRQCELSGRALGCWCVPDEACHAELLTEYVEQDRPVCVHDRDPGTRNRAGRGFAFRDGDHDR
jgi:hypothetical protein